MRKLNKYDMGSYEYGICYATNGTEILFDKEDYEKICKYTWSIKPGHGYAIASPLGKNIRMHKLIMGDIPKGMEVDHINGNPADNRKANLRICTHADNQKNMKKYSNNTTGVTGVYWDKTRNKWMAVITENKTTHNLGRFETFDEAVKARQEAEKMYFGEFRRT